MQLPLYLLPEHFYPQGRRACGAVTLAPTPAPVCPWLWLVLWLLLVNGTTGLPRWLSGEESTCQAGDSDPPEKEMATRPAQLLGKPHDREALVGPGGSMGSQKSWTILRD